MRTIEFFLSGNQIRIKMVRDRLLSVGQWIRENLNCRLPTPQKNGFRQLASEVEYSEQEYRLENPEVKGRGDLTADNPIRSF